MRAATVDEILEFVRANPRAFLLGRRSDGYPTAWAMTAGAGDGVIEFTTYRKSAKVKHLLREGVAGVVVQADDGRMLITGGPIEAVDGHHWLDEASGGDTRRPPEAHREVPPSVTEKVRSRHQDGKRIVLRVRIEGGRFADHDAPGS
jgi:hypothetical protein